ncbi:Methyltransferase domain-containing protein [Pseudomonas sp. ok272]|uniref:class I SAM-dependent methyltransferase n=1 Tax=unclassified Pseudomonas TaxID=196821 RepID=UPI0008C54E67|nr:MULTISPECIES: class I SAM-dependent methyltransferase [unclassified Pseudomonas]SEN06219.1 Methyltransferase domain-containing protein [Pseudomonas sp. ok272]SFN00255.1 Methyltransferase domain-containing protein [Pseudomonas sp. ok602]
MDRRQKVTQFILPGAKGIEIGPWCNPLTPKSAGYDCTVLDVFDTLTLKARANADPSISKEQEGDIEDVDLVGSSSQIAELVEGINALGAFDYIVSSHNLEHVPDLIKFFQGCERVLKPGGVLSMAIPDRRGCFDFFRPNSSLADVLDSHFTNRVQPSAAQIFEHSSLYARQVLDGVSVSGFHTGVKATNIEPFETLAETFDIWKARVLSKDTAYIDVHCWTFTPSSFELIFKELSFLGLTKLDLLSIEAMGGEFHVHFRNKAEQAKWINEDFYKQRLALLQKINNEACVTSPLFQHYVAEVVVLEQYRKEEKVGSRRGLEGQHSKSKREKEPLELKVEKVKHELEVVKQELADSRMVVAALKNSSSWKFTAPLRYTIEKLRVVLRMP